MAQTVNDFRSGEIDSRLSSLSESGNSPQIAIDAFKVTILALIADHHHPSSDHQIGNTARDFTAGRFWNKIPPRNLLPGATII